MTCSPACYYCVTVVPCCIENQSAQLILHPEQMSQFLCLIFQIVPATTRPPYQPSPPPPGPPYQCSRCNESLTTLQGYRYHVQRHSGVYPYYCPYCGKGVSCTKDMKTHLKARHTGVSGFSCLACRGQYDTVHQLTAHLHQYRGMCAAAGASTAAGAVAVAVTSSVLNLSSEVPGRNSTSSPVLK